MAEEMCSSVQVLQHFLKHGASVGWGSIYALKSKADRVPFTPAAVQLTYSAVEALPVFPLNMGGCTMLLMMLVAQVIFISAAYIYIY